jgi:D-tyrosyl-tRNA(Tyr) deacylase
VEVRRDLESHTFESRQGRHVAAGREYSGAVRAVLQRVTAASVQVDGAVVGSIDAGLVVLLGITHDDGEAEARTLAEKIHQLRILRGEQSLATTGGGALVISQFTLYADTRKGRRPSWNAAAPGPVAEPLYELFCAHLSALDVPVATGTFGADMAVTLTNDGPVTVILDS